MKMSTKGITISSYFSLQRKAKRKKSLKDKCTLQLTQKPEYVFFSCVHEEMYLTAGGSWLSDELGSKRRDVYWVGIQR